MIPAALHPPALTQAQSTLRELRRHGARFWMLLLPMTWGIWELLAALSVSGPFGRFLLTMGGMLALIVGRIAWKIRQRPRRLRALKTIHRFRRLPEDPRWDASMVLLERISALGAGDPVLPDTARRLVGVLFHLYEDLQRLERTLQADQILDGEGAPSDRYYRLLAVRTHREAQLEGLLNALRDLHVELNEQLAEQLGPVQERLGELMDQMEADREVVRIAGLRVGAELLQGH